MTSLADLGDPRLRCSRDELIASLRGTVTAHHWFLLGQHLRMVEELDESAGKQRSTRLRKGAPWLKTVLVQCARAAARNKGTYLQAQFLCLRSRHGSKKPAVAVAASILTAAYYMLRDAMVYRDLGPDYFGRRDEARVAQRLARRIRDAWL